MLMSSAQTTELHSSSSGLLQSNQNLQSQTLLGAAMMHLAPTQNSDKGVLIDRKSGFQFIAKSIGSLLAKDVNWNGNEALLERFIM